MTELVLEVSPRTVLEVGTGSGYQAAILSQLVEKVYSTERIEPLASQARQRFRRLGYRNIRVQHSDGSWGWPQFGPFDAIIVTAGGAEIPPALLEQLPGRRQAGDAARRAGAADAGFCHAYRDRI